MARGRRVTSAQGITTCLVPAMMWRYGKLAEKLLDLSIWDKRISRNEIWEKHASPDRATLKKQFGIGLEWIYGHSKYLVIWAFGPKNELWQPPNGCLL